MSGEDKECMHEGDEGGGCVPCAVVLSKVFSLLMWSSTSAQKGVIWREGNSPTHKQDTPSSVAIVQLQPTTPTVVYLEQTAYSPLPPPPQHTHTHTQNLNLASYSDAKPLQHRVRGHPCLWNSIRRTGCPPTPLKMTVVKTSTDFTTLEPSV